MPSSNVTTHFPIEPELHLMALAAKVRDADNPTYDQAMASDDADGFRDCMDQEIHELAKKKAWILVDVQKALDEGQRLLDLLGYLKGKGTLTDD